MGKLTPALNEREWRDVDAATSNTVAAGEVVDPADLYRAIAMSNALLPDGDPHKMTWEMVRALRAAADAMESFLQRRGTT